MINEIRVNEMVAMVGRLCADESTELNALMEPLTFAEDGIEPIAQKMDEITQKIDSADLSAGQKAILEAQLMRLEIDLEPYKWMQDRILDFITRFKSRKKKLISSLKKNPCLLLSMIFILIIFRDFGNTL